MVAKVYEKLCTDSRPTVPFEEVRELLPRYAMFDDAGYQGAFRGDLDVSGTLDTFLLQV